MSGHVRISRDLWDDEAFADDAFSEREAWVWMIAEASWKPRTRRVGDYIADLQRGQLAASVRFMAKAWKWTPAKVQRFLKKLKKLNLIRSEADTGVSVITICKYDEYQAVPRGGDTPPIQERYTSDTNENKGERREEGKEKGDTNVSPCNPVPANDVSEAVTAYNLAADSAGWPQVQKMNPNRSRLLRARLAECGGIEGWEVAMKKAQDSDFLSGRTAKPWTGFSFDWAIKAANFTKLMEGNYDNRDSNSQNGSGGSGGMAAAFGAVAARRSAAAGRSGGHGGGSF